jgi:two-component system chemotaxis sensor kinase CheA
VGIVIEKVLDILDDDLTRHSQTEDGGEVGSTVLAGWVTELIDVRRVVLRGDPSFFDADAATGPFELEAAGVTLGAVAV